MGDEENMVIRKSTEKDVERMMEIFAYARNFMAEHRNPNQWGPINWPPKELICHDISEGNSYVCIHKGKAVGTFFYIFGEDIDPTYRIIENGEWLDDTPYGVVHRLAGDGSVKGIGKFCLNWAYEQCCHLRVETHENNIVLQNILQKLGFTRCGIIHIKEDNYPRIAYEKSARIDYIGRE